MTTSTTPVLVLGATGKTGRRVAARARAAGHDVRAASRSSAVRFDWDDHSTWEPALGGARAVYLVPPVLRLDGTAQLVADMARFAADRGVGRIVLLSARGIDQAGESQLLQSERTVQAAGPAWTILRPSWFAQNFSEDWFLAGIASGTLSLPAGGGAEPFVDVDDIAEVAVAALAGADGGRHDGQIYELSGPRAITFPDAVLLIARATGRTISYRDADPEELVAERVAAGVPADYARLLADLLAIVANGWDAATSDGVERALGRPARPFEDYVTTTAASGVWG